jgi:multidrug efflux system membrane fusion protein
MALLLLSLTAAIVYVVRTRFGAAKPPAPQIPPGVPVMATAAKRADVGVYLTGLGSVTPLHTVIVRSRVDGQLMRLLFREGQLVRRGQLLATIDPRPFEVQLKQAEGQMARDRALLENAKLDLERYRVLWKQDAVPKQQLDTQKALVHQYQGVVKLDEGLIQSAKLQLVYCHITAPVSGRVGLQLVDPGNIIRAADPTGIVVIAQLQPIAVLFTLAEDRLPEVLAALRTGRRLRVEAYDRELRRRLATGYLLTVDNQIDSSTGTVRLKAQFPNKRGELFPSQFVNARLLLRVLRAVVVVPAAAVQRGPQGTFVYAVGADQTAILRPVRVAQVEGGQAAIESGLSAGELVIVEGAERLHPGAKLTVRPPGRGGP